MRRPRSNTPTATGLPAAPAAPAGGLDLEALSLPGCEADAAARPAARPDPFGLIYRFWSADQPSKPVRSWAHLLQLLGLLGRDGAHAFLVVDQVDGPLAAQAVGDAGADRLLCEVLFQADSVDQYTAAYTDRAPDDVFVSTGFDPGRGLARGGVEMTSVDRLGVLRLTADRALSVLDTARTFRAWFQDGQAPEGIRLDNELVT
ncbi:hypothetical protein [Xylanimonas ulmi]|uniref:Uncharacterized protein n=1 Tax=Xylanimonas ulmi TaxID=228973 RepID=A0A4Q7M4E7_9MICO|nr:hypothetical protein [Xylanibacterium ulmi]RZS62241.1 hypothetical protein EV386_2566 [Xylanibacterium ulmi]